MVLRRVALTGVSGMVGRHLYDALIADGFVVIPSCRTRPSWIDSADWVHWDLTEWCDKQTLDLYFGQADVIIHAGAMVPKTDLSVIDTALFDANVRSSLNLGLWALDRGLSIIYISGAIVYAEPFSNNITENMAIGQNGLGGFYGLTKLLAEEIFSHLRKRGLMVSILRPSSIYGSGLPATKLLPTFLSKALRGDTIDITPPIDDKIDLVHAADLAQAIIAVIKKKRLETFNIAAEKPVSVLDMARACLDVVSGGGKLNFIESKTREPTVKFGLNCTLAHDILDWYPSVTLHKGLEMMLHQETLLSG